jgi:hypothetical protein
MKRWAILTVLLYLGVLVLLTVPMVVFALWKWLLSEADGQKLISFREAFEIYRQWGYWVWLTVMVVSQGLLLFLPLGVAERRLTARRHLLVPVVTAAFLLANLFFAGAISLLCLAFDDEAFKPFEFFGETGARNAFLRGAVQQVGITPSHDFFTGFSLIGFILLIWLVWGLLFFRFSRTSDPGALNKRLTRWLLNGSILELLVAVPSHIIVRNRDNCCAPFGTFWGIVTGLSIMLLAFGPGVFFLFVERFQRLRPADRPPVLPAPPDTTSNRSG